MINIEVGNGLHTEDSSFLSAYVQKILQDYITYEGVTDPECVNADGTLNWKYLQDNLPVEDCTEQNQETYFVECARFLAPISHFVADQWKSGKPDVCSLLQWTSSPKLLLNALALANNDDVSSDIITSILLSTSVLERSLGDIFLLHGDQCPSMLKDLLVTAELTAVFGPTVMQLLRVLIGPPKSLNIRNLVWHGFPSPTEIPQHCAILLLCVIASLGQLLLKRGISLEDIRHRKYITLTQLDEIYQLFSGISIDNCVLKSIFKQSIVISTNMLPYWMSALSKFNSQRYGECVILLLPQLEHVLRRLFAYANESPARVLTAESSVLFTTLDEILKPLLEDGKENKLKYLIGDHLLMLLLDLLTYRAGPRLRDHVSHGEVDMEDCPKHWAITLLFICCGLCLCEQRVVCHQEVIIQLQDTLAGYQACFHPIAMLKKQIRQVAISLSHWITIPRPSVVEIESKVDWHIYGDVTSNPAYHVAMAIASVSHCGSRNLCSIINPFNDITDTVDSVLARPIDTLYRHCSQLVTGDNTIQKYECQVEGLLTRIASECLNVSEQISTVLKNKYTEWQRKQLRSRQRNTYSRMLDSTPIISSGLRLVVLILAVHLYALDELYSINSSTFEKIVRSLKSVLQYVENVNSSTNINKNKWDLALQLTHHFINNMKHKPILIIN